MVLSDTTRGLRQQIYLQYILKSTTIQMPHPAFDHLFSHFLQADPANFECLTNFTLFENYLKYRI